MAWLPRSLLALTCALLVMTGPGADELLMKDGSRLVGEVVKRENDILEFKTGYAGVIKVKWSEVSEVIAEKPLKLMLDDETTRTAKQIRSEDDGIYLDEDAAPEVSEPTLDQSELAYINPAPWRTGEGHKFNGAINFAFERERGNTDEDELDIDGNLVWRYLDHRVRVFGELERDHNNNEKTKDKWKLRNHYDHFLDKQLFVGAFLGLEHDQFADLDLRTIVGPKVGYQWFESTKMNLTTEIGLTYVDEQFDQAEDDDYAALGWAIDFDRFLIDGIMQFYHRQTGVWSLEDTGDLVWDTWTGLRFPLIMGFVASTEMQVEYDGGAPSNTDEVDTTYSLKIGYAW